MRVLALLSTLACASAFIPAAPLAGSKTFGRARGVVKATVNDLIGVDVETGGLFDPLGFSKKESELVKYRAVELKHGRVAMLGVLGIWIQASGLHLPDPVFSETKPLAAVIKIALERPAALIQLLAAITWIESVAGKESDDKAPGDLGKFGDQFKPEDPEEYAALQLKELKNGRLAMIASIGLLVQEIVTGQNVWEQFSTGHVSPFGDGQGLF